MITILPGLYVLLLIFSATLLLILGFSITARERFSGTSLRLLTAILPVLLSMLALAYLIQISRRTAAPLAALPLARLAVVGYYLAAPTLLLLISSIFGQYRRHRLSLAVMGLISLCFTAGALFGSLIVGGLHRFEFGLFPRLTNLGLSYFLLSYTLFVVILYRYWTTNPASPRQITLRRGWFFSLVGLALLSPVDVLIMAGMHIYPLGFIFITGFFIVAAAGIWRYRLDLITPSLAAEEILAIMDDPLLVCDAQDRIRISNRAFSTTFGFSVQETSDRELDLILRCRHGKPVSRILDEDGTEDIEILAGDGDYIPVRVSATPLSSNGRGALGRVIILRDIRPFKEAESRLEERVKERTRNLLDANAALEREVRERERAEQDLRISRERYELISRGTSDGIWDWDLENDTVYFSPRWREIIGIDSHEEIHSPADWIDRIHPDDRPQVTAAIEAHIRGETDSFHSEHRIKGTGRKYRWIQSRGLAARNRRGTAYRFAGSLSDITTRKEYEYQLIHDAYHDALTGLPNRNAFLERLNQVFGKFRRDPRRLFAVLFMDLDRFKVINDSMGHQIGDLVLREAAVRLKACCRLTDTVARIGGDEFVVLIEDVTDPEEVVKAAERIRDEMNRGFSIEAEEIYSGVSIGIALSADGYRDADEILRDADTAMYRAKAQGKARFALFDREMHTLALSQMQIEQELHRALANRELELFYQPIVDLDTDVIVGFEALLRWRHPQRGLLLPGSFIAVAEESDLIVEIGTWVIEEATQTLADWQRDAAESTPLKMSINLAARQLDEKIIGVTKRAIESSGIAAGSLIFEISEKSIITDFDKAAGTLEELKAMNIEIHMDDFGEGYSSMSLLHKLPIDTMKIDRAFITGKTEDAKEREIVRAIIDLGHNMKKRIVAEGIEAAAEAATLNTLNCELGQGFHFSAPVPRAEAEALLRRVPAGAVSAPDSPGAASDT